MSSAGHQSVNRLADLGFKRCRLVKIHHKMNPGLKDKLGCTGVIITDVVTGKVLVQFEQTDNNYGRYWINPKYLEMT